ncbi:fungal-specific transcription factor domain-containing protein [Plectosphaerella plurivora]|uniref:Fungal-specific transcription factor domain-containing protein n=1 Tax=Plectosphaerella plurivora TaxID=936078 RepID=A0A9P9AFY7_9PEZI|nr:fungal-specific transcription factor domain-containing protein [Plectosphaerella plurivora]
MMEAVESPHASSDPGTPGISPADLGRLRKRKFSTATSTDRSTRELGLMRDSGRSDTAQFVGSSSGIHFIRHVYLRLARKSATRPATPCAQATNDYVPGEDDQLLRRSSSRDGSEQDLWKENETTADLDNGSDHPSFEQLVDWSRSYFESWHPTLPFLGAPDVLALFEKVSQVGITGISHLDGSIVKSVLSISLADSRQGLPLSSPVPANLVFRTVEEAMFASQHALFRPASLKATQAAIGIQLFLISMLRLNSASRLGGLIVRMAFHLGLHRCPARFRFFHPGETQMRRRIFWCIYSLERFLCQSLGLPLDIRDDDIDVCFPGEERHGPQEPPDNRLLLFTSLAKHARIRGLILELRNKSISSRHDNAEQASYVQAELAKWSNEIHDLVDDHDGFSDGGPTESPAPSIRPNHRLYLLLLKHESTISLNRPMMTSDPLGATYAAALQECIFAAKSILSTLRKHTSQFKVQEDPGGDRLRQPMLWPSCTWAIWISAFVLIFAAVEGQLHLTVAQRYVESSKEILRHIAARNTSWPEYCLSAIDELTAAIKDLSTDADRSELSEPSHASGSQLFPEVYDDTSENSPSARTAQNSGPRYMADTGVTGIPPAGTVSQQKQPPNSAAESLAAKMQRRSGQSGARELQREETAFDQPLSRALAASSFASMPGSFMPSETVGEGQESMIWFDQLFANAFGAIDYPVLASAQFDPSVDPSWQ